MSCRSNALVKEFHNFTEKFRRLREDLAVTPVSVSYENKIRIICILCIIYIVTICDRNGRIIFAVDDHYSRIRILKSVH